jgi:hypothetical protein
MMMPLNFVPGGNGGRGGTETWAREEKGDHNIGRHVRNKSLYPYANTLITCQDAF